MPEKLLLNQDIHVPLMIGMVAQARAFIIDKAMLSLIIVFFGAATASGALMYQINEQGKTIDKFMAKQDKMLETINSQNVEIGKLTVKVANLNEIMGRIIRFAE